MSAQDKTNKSPQKVPYQHPLRNALGWVVCYFIAAGVVEVFFYIFRDYIGELFGAKDSLWTIENFIKVAIGIFALFAFVVTIWRGNLHAQQVSGQMEQLKLGREQLEKTEDNNIAKLLVDSTKLLGDDMSDAEKIAGVACLAQIIEAKSKFAKQAVDILILFCKRISSKEETGIYMGSAKYIYFFHALKAIDRYAEMQKNTITLDYITVYEPRRGAQIITFQFLQGIVYRQVHFFNMVFTDKIAPFYINGCQFENCIIDDKSRFVFSPVKRLLEGMFDTTYYNTFFRNCIFIAGQNDASGYSRTENFISHEHKFYNCYYDDAVVCDPIIIKFYTERKIGPLSKTLVHTEPVGPRKLI